MQKTHYYCSKNSFEQNEALVTSTKVTSTFLLLILSFNNFAFNFKNFLQTNRLAMGTICAHSYANLFMVVFKSKYIYPFILKICWGVNCDSLTISLKN